ncbi:predicted protein [Histoplasma mississippiense (nom. inval.)]|uniref:predicted protein n=1 Tax=Ajellomyces capsulatus (strain NAm1 / WU24) TaxID=2059318 RepID=UPI000157CA20|nr:predicted protein [Histoplasma mississippiense (nom. inval.)]EDN09729.1 predicted protein [Histoplasma mississippiense (nom. inval.)]
MDDHSMAATGFDSMLQFMHDIYFPQVAFGLICLNLRKTLIIILSIDILGFSERADVCIFEKGKGIAVEAKEAEFNYIKNVIINNVCSSTDLSLTSRRKHGQRPCFRSLLKGMETCYAGEISMYIERENRIQVATLEKTQLISKDFSELRIHFWPDERALKKVVKGNEQRMTERAKKRRKKKHLSR